MQSIDSVNQEPPTLWECCRQILNNIDDDQLIFRYQRGDLPIWDWLVSDLLTNLEYRLYIPQTAAWSHARRAPWGFQVGTEVIIWDLELGQAINTDQVNLQLVGQRTRLGRTTLWPDDLKLLLNKLSEKMNQIYGLGRWDVTTIRSAGKKYLGHHIPYDKSS